MVSESAVGGVMSCTKCGGSKERGSVVGSPFAGLTFLVPGTPTSTNVATAFKQGLAGEPSDTRYLISGARCTKCGFLELYAQEPEL